MSGLRKTVIVCGALFLSACATHDQQIAPGSKARTFEGVAVTFDRSKGKFYKIYADRLKTRPGLTGRIVFRFTIAADGSVVQTGIVESTLNDREVESGINAVIAKLDFGPAQGPGNQTFTIPIELLP